VTVLVVQYKVEEASVAAFDAGIEKMFAAIEQEQPKGIRYAMGRLPDGVTVVGILELEDGVHNPLPGIAAARAFQEDLKGWVVGGRPPAPEKLDVIGSYELFS
jgi:hypothetical protein